MVFGGGIDLLSPETKAKLRVATNIDIDDTGGPTRRSGFTAALVDGAAYHSGFHSKRGICLVGKGPALHMFDPLTNTSSLLTALGSAAQLSYTENNGDIFFSSETGGIGMIPFPTTSARMFSNQTPEPPVATTGTDYGNIPAGAYKLAVTVTDDLGEESGLSGTSSVTLAATGRVYVQLPNIATGATTNVFITSEDGEALRLVGSYSHLISSINITEQPFAGAIPTTLGMAPLPAGRFIATLGGRMYSARGDTLYFTEPYRRSLYSKAHGWMKFDTAISFIGPVDDGLYVGDSRGVWFVDGADPVKQKMTFITPIRAVPCSSISVPAAVFPQELIKTDKPVALWLARNGYTAGLPGGNIVLLQDKRIKLPAVQLGMTAAPALIEREGFKQVISPVNFPLATSGIAEDSTY